MRDRGLIAAGLVLFLGSVSFPIWYNPATGKKARGLELALPAREKNCVASVAYMKTSHMKLLYEWRDQAVRIGQRTYTSYDGKVYNISLVGTCLSQCHLDRTAFCDRCHAYNGVNSPDCWQCHLDPLAVGPRQSTGAVPAGASHDR